MGGYSSRDATTEPGVGSIPPVTRRVPRVGMDMVQSDDDEVILPLETSDSYQEPEEVLVQSVKAAIDAYREAGWVPPTLPLDGSTTAGVNGDWEIRGDQLVGVVARGQVYLSVIMTSYLRLEDVVLPLLKIELLDQRGDVEATIEGDENNLVLRELLRKSPGLGARVFLGLGDHFWVDFSADPPVGLEEDHERVGGQLWSIMERTNTKLTPNQEKLSYHGNLRDAIFYDYQSASVLINIFAADNEAPGAKADIQALTDVYTWLYTSQALEPPSFAPGQMEQAANDNADRRSLRENLTMARYTVRIRDMLSVIDMGGIPDPNSYTFFVRVYETDEWGFEELDFLEKHDPSFEVSDLEMLSALGRKEFVLDRCFGSWTRF